MVSRLLMAAGSQVIKIGSARSSRYAAVREVTRDRHYRESGSVYNSEAGQSIFAFALEQQVDACFRGNASHTWAGMTPL